MSRLKALLPAAVALLGLAGCGSSAAPPNVATNPSTSTSTVGSTSEPAPSVAPTAAPTPAPPPPRAQVAVREFHEPTDHAHRNYCGAGATQVLLSGWMQNVPDIEVVARQAKLDPNSGQTGANTAVAINEFIAPIVAPKLGHARYRGEHLDTLAAVLQRLRADLPDAQATQLFGHGVPVMLQTWTETMPGWNGWRATHMITISAYDLSTGDPDRDTVTYAETPSAIAGYTGPPFRSITLNQLWVAMQNYTARTPSDPINVIS